MVQRSAYLAAFFLVTWPFVAFSQAEEVVDLIAAAAERVEPTLNAEMIAKVMGANGEPSGFNTRFAMRADLRSVLVQSRVPSPSGSEGLEFLVCLNPDYCFELNRKSGKTDWQLKDYTIRDSEDVTPRSLEYSFPLGGDYFDRAEAKLTFNGVMNDFVDIVEQLQTGKMTVESWSMENDDVVSLAYSRENPDASSEGLIAGKMLIQLTPAAALQKVSESNGTISINASFKTEFDGTFPRSLASKISYQGGPSVQTTSEVISTDVDDGVFRLTEYGFPEPVELETSVFTSTLAACLALLLALGGFFLYRQRLAR